MSRRFSRKIRNNHIMPSYTFPDNMRISDNAKDVITSLLVNDPGKQPSHIPLRSYFIRGCFGMNDLKCCSSIEKRPTIKQLLAFPFFRQDFLPAAIPVCALQRPPTELDYSNNTTASKSVASPDNAAAALQRATERDGIYSRKSQTPLENLELLSGTPSISSCLKGVLVIYMLLLLERLPDPRQMFRSTQSSRSNWNLSNVPGTTIADSERHNKRYKDCG